MNIADYFRPIDTMTAEEVRKFLASRDPSEYNLIDVRQPREYEQGHIPGARLIPLSKFPDRLAELDPAKPTIAY